MPRDKSIAVIFYFLLLLLRNPRVVGACACLAYLQRQSTLLFSLSLGKLQKLEAFSLWISSIRTVAPLSLHNVSASFPGSVYFPSATRSAGRLSRLLPVSPAFARILSGPYISRCTVLSRASHEILCSERFASTSIFVTIAVVFMWIATKVISKIRIRIEIWSLDEN